jgi:cyclic pyranopterin phosphate synthase
MTMWHSIRRAVCRQSTTLLQADSGCFTSSCSIHVDGQINQFGYLWGNKGHLTSDWSRWGFLSLSQSRSGVASLAARPDRVPSDGKVQSTKVKLWRDSLPSVQDVRQRLKEQTDGLDWRHCVQVSRDAYAKEFRIPGKREAEYMSFREFLVNRSLVDTHSRRHSYLRISLTEKCNLRCLYCMPEDGVDLTPQQRLLTVDEIERIVRLFALAGVNKVRLTGGEPTIRKDLPDIVSRISSIEGIADVGITSNGLVLSRSLKELKESGLSLVNLSLDTLKPNRFETMTRRKGHNRVLSSIDTALELGFDPVKVNVVVMKGVNDDEIPDFVERTRDACINVRFIEYMPFDGNVWSTEKLVSYKEMKDTVEEYAMKVSGSKLIRFDDGYGEVAKNYAIPGFKGTVSFVTSMTSAFCGDCNRLRLMADGNLKVCLFGNNEVSLRDAIREGATDDDLLAVISAAVDRKKAAHAGMNILASLKNRPMVKIGG